MFKLEYQGVNVDLYFYYLVGTERWIYTLRKFGKTLSWRRPDFDLKMARFGPVEIAVPNPPEEFLVAAYGINWRRPVLRWSKYCEPNLRPVGGALVQMRFKFKRWLWHRKNGDIYAPMAARQRTVVLTDGVFDMFHVNHLALLREAKALGDRLVVAVVSDEMAISYKGRPVIAEEERLEIVKAIDCVDDAFVMRGELVPETLARYVDEYDVSIVAYAGDGFEAYYSQVKAGGMYRQLNYHPGISSGEIRERIRKRAEEIKKT